MIDDDDDEIPYQAHSDTSREAAESMIGKSGTLKRRVYEYLRQYGPATDQKTSVALGLSDNSGRPRRVKLMQDGLVRAYGTTCDTPSGRRATLWGLV